MRLDEFYNPEDDQYDRRKKDDVRKPVLTLEKLNKLRRYRALKNLENIQYQELVSIMYRPSSGGEAGI